MTELEIFLLDTPATAQLGQALGRAARGGDCLLLSGDLGAGKTCLTQGLAQGLGIAEVVSSPTFSLLNEYQGRLKLSHFDLYRLTPPEIIELGFVDYWDHAPGVIVIEWPERAQGSETLLPEDALNIHLEHVGDGRRALVTATGRASERWLSEAQGYVARP